MKVALPSRLPGLSVPVEGAVQAGPPRRVPRQAVRGEAFHAGGLQRGDLERRILVAGAHAGVANQPVAETPGEAPVPCYTMRRFPRRGGAAGQGGAGTGRAVPDKPSSLRRLVRRMTAATAASERTAAGPSVLETNHETPMRGPLPFC